jgi:UDP-3-O-[3-hydroxymyristoyl] glucosamine N-acyltransferase
MVDTRFYANFGPRPLVELIDGLDVEIPEGQFGDIEINNAAPVDQAGVSDISFFEGRKAELRLENCKAAACFVTQENAEHVGAQNTIAVISKTPRADFARVLDRLYQPHQFNAESVKFDGVHIAQGGVIGSGAQVGKGTSIGPNTVIGRGVKIGNNCKIGANVVVEFADLGDNCVIQGGAVIGGSGFGVAMTKDGCVDIPHIGTVKIGNHVSIGSQTTVDRAMFGSTSIGDGCKIDNLVQIAHNVKMGTNCILAGHVGVSGSCVIGNNVVLGGAVGLADHLTIGDGVVLAASSGVMHDIPAGEKWGGTPATPLRQQMRQLMALKRLVEKKSK